MYEVNPEFVLTANGQSKLRKHEEGLAPTWKRVTVEKTKTGQSRAYADGIDEAFITFEGGTTSTRSGYDCTFAIRYTESQVKALTQVMVRGFCENPTHGLHARLEVCEIVNEGPFSQTWRVVVRTPNCD